MYQITSILLILIIIIIIIYTIKSKYYDVQILNFNENINDNNNDYIDDVSQFNKTKICQIFYPINKYDIINIIDDAKNNNKKISMRGTKHSMGGHTIVNDGYIIDMANFNKIIEFDPDNYTITVEPGITWSQLILFLDKYSLSPMTLQSYSSFSVGGTISVNAHGITNDYGIYNSVLKITIINSLGKEITCGRIKNFTLFSLIIGGYGLFGIITSVKLKLINNSKLNLEFIKLNKYTFCDKYNSILNDDSIDIKIARININNMNDIYLYVFRKQITNRKIISSVNKKNPEMSKLSQLLYKWILPDTSFQKVRYKIENIIEKPIDIISDNYERNLILYESAEPLAKLYNPIIDINATHILQEFFIPPNNFLNWMNCLKYTFSQKYKYVTLLNITIRYVKKDTISFLNYATQDMYAFVLYYRLPKRISADNELRKINQILTEKVIDLNGTFYLPYRHHYTKDQLKKCYPQIDKFFEFKKYYDPIMLFSNQWSQKFDNIN